MAWREEVYRGDPWDVAAADRTAWEAQNLFKQDRFVSTRMVDSITFTDAGKSFLFFTETHQHRRWIMQYDFTKKGTYRIGYTTDDGMRIKVSGINNGLPLRTDSWKVQDDTAYYVDFDINTLGPQEVTVEHFNHEREWTARVNGPFLIKEFATPEDPVVTPSPLLNSIVFTPPANTIVKTYIKDSLALIEPDTLFVKNISNTYLLQVSLQGQGGITFDPGVIQLQPLEEKSTQIKFNSNTINQYTAGRNQVNCLVSVAALGVQTPDVPVDEPTPVSFTITINPTQVTMDINQSQQFRATVLQGTTAVQNAQVTWSTNNPSVMTVNSAGLGTAIAAGLAVITVSYSGISARAAVTVRTPVVNDPTVTGTGGTTGGTTGTRDGGGSVDTFTEAMI